MRLRLKRSPRTRAGWTQQTGCASVETNLSMVAGGIEPTRQQVVDVVGLPTSPEEEAIPYTIPALQAELDAVRSLRAGVHELRKGWPL